MLTGERSSTRFVVVVVSALALVSLIVACSSSASEETTGASQPSGTDQPPGTDDLVVATNAKSFPDGEPEILEPELPEGTETLKYTVGPLDIRPGQNSIEFTDADIPKPEVDGYIVGIRPDLVYNDGTVPRVDVIHLHHGVWLNTSAKDSTRPRLPERFFAAGEEKTHMYLPDGYGYPYKATDKWIINYMLHNLLATPDEVSITYEIDFIPATAPEAAAIQPARPAWMDVQNGETYPVFDVIKGEGTDGLYTYPDDAIAPYPEEPKNEWTVDRDSVLIGTGGHLHPGGLQTDLYVTRPGAGATATPEAAAMVEGDTANLFTSKAYYYEPAGAVSWDVAMTVTPEDYRVALKAGDVLSMNTTYDSERASWYESMGIMVMWLADGSDGADPFATKVNVDGPLTHGHLPENDNHGGEESDEFVDMTKLANGATTGTVTIADFTYSPGDMSGMFDDVPTIKPGQSLLFDNSVDAPLEKGIWHTITACKAPCDGATGVAYPLADADISFDSGELGDAGPPTAGRIQWSTPTDLPEGTYTYFCRVHPIMRGAFRIDNG
jgi:plastocyanin